MHRFELDIGEGTMGWDNGCLLRRFSHLPRLLNELPSSDHFHSDATYYVLATTKLDAEIDP
jgi:hypothetical protein